MSFILPSYLPAFVQVYYVTNRDESFIATCTIDPKTGEKIPSLKYNCFEWAQQSEKATEISLLAGNLKYQTLNGKKSVIAIYQDCVIKIFQNVSHDFKPRLALKNS